MVAESTEDWLVNIPDNSEVRVGLIFAHGAGVGKDHEFMEAVAQALYAANIAVIRFDFPYMCKIRETSTHRPPDKMDVLEASFKSIIIAAEKSFPTIQWSLAGKSLGGRVATHVLADSEFTYCANSKNMRTAACLGYPFHPPKKPESLRVDNLNAVENTLLIFQGTRDVFGTTDDVREYSLNSNVLVHWLEDGDHDLHPRKSSGLTFDQHLAEFTSQIAAFLLENYP